MDKELIDKLPESAKLLLEVINEDSLFSLIREYDGTSIHIPKTAPQHCYITALIGVAEFAKLSAVYGGEYIILPR